MVEDKMKESELILGTLSASHMKDKAALIQSILARNVYLMEEIKQLENENKSNANLLLLIHEYESNINEIGGLLKDL